MVTDSIRNTKKKQTNLCCPVFSSGPSGPKLHWEEGRHGWIVDIKSLLDGEGAIWPFAVFFKAKCFFPVEPQGERFWKYIYIYKSLWLSPLLRAHFVWFIRAVAGGRTVYLLQQWTVPDRKQNYSITSTGVYNGKHLCTALSGQRWRIWLLKLPKALSTGDHDSMMVTCLFGLTSLMTWWNAQVWLLSLDKTWWDFPSDFHPESSNWRAAASWSQKWWVICWSVGPQQS